MKLISTSLILFHISIIFFLILSLMGVNSVEIKLIICKVEKLRELRCLHAWHVLNQILKWQGKKLLIQVNQVNMMKTVVMIYSSSFNFFHMSAFKDELVCTHFFFTVVTLWTSYWMPWTSSILSVHTKDLQAAQGARVKFLTLSLQSWVLGWAFLPLFFTEGLGVLWWDSKHNRMWHNWYTKLSVFLCHGMSKEKKTEKEKVGFN